MDSSFHKLPIEIQWQIINHISNVKIIRHLILSSPNVRECVNRCIIHLLHHNISNELILMFKRLIDIYDLIVIFESLGDLLMLENFNFKKACFVYQGPPLNILDIDVWISTFLDSYVQGKYFLHGIIRKHHRNLSSVDFTFQFESIQIVLQHAIFRTDAYIENYPRILKNPFIKGIFKKCRFDYSIPLLNIHRLEISTLFDSYDKDLLEEVKSYLCQNKLSTLIDYSIECGYLANPQQNSEILLSIPKYNQKHCTLRKAKMPFNLHDVIKIIQRYHLLEVVGIMLTADNLDESQHIITQIIQDYPRIRKIYIYANKFYHTDEYSDILTKFLTHYTGRQDTLVFI